MGGIAPHAKVVEQLAHLLGLSLGPFEIRGIKLDALISHLSYGAYRGLWIFLETLAHGIQLEANRYGRCRCRTFKRPGQRRGESQERTPGQRHGTHSNAFAVRNSGHIYMTMVMIK